MVHVRAWTRWAATSALIAFPLLRRRWRRERVRRRDSATEPFLVTARSPSTSNAQTLAGDLLAEARGASARPMVPTRLQSSLDRCVPAFFCSLPLSSGSWTPHFFTPDQKISDAVCANASDLGFSFDFFATRSSVSPVTSPTCLRSPTRSCQSYRTTITPRLSQPRLRTISPSSGPRCALSAGNCHQSREPPLDAEKKNTGELKPPFKTIFQYSPPLHRPTETRRRHRRRDSESAGEQQQPIIRPRRRLVNVIAGELFRLDRCASKVDQVRLIPPGVRPLGPFSNPRLLYLS
jgi:hypothetical protein